MDGRTLFFLLLLPLFARSDVVAIEKTLGNKPDVTPLCSNTTEGGIALVMCHINTGSSGEQCLLSRRHGQDTVSTCDSRFTFMTENQTVFLHLTNLTQQDSGNFSCQCSHSDGHNKIHIKITVEAEEEEANNKANNAKEMPWLLMALSAAFALIIVTVFILGCAYRRARNGREQPQSCCLNQEPQDIEPYSTFIRKESGLYSTVIVQSFNPNNNNNNSNMFIREDIKIGHIL